MDGEPAFLLAIGDGRVDVHLRAVAQSADKGTGQRGPGGRVGRVGIGRHLHAADLSAPGAEQAPGIEIFAAGNRERPGKPGGPQTLPKRQGQARNDDRPGQGRGPQMNPRSRDHAVAIAPAERGKVGCGRDGHARQRRRGAKHRGQQGMDGVGTEERAFPARAIFHHQRAQIDAHDHSGGEERGREVQRAGNAGSGQGRGEFRPASLKGVDSPVERRAPVEIAARRACNPADRARERVVARSPDAFHRRNRKPQIDEEVPRDSAEQRHGEQVHPPPLAELVRRETQRQRCQRQNQADPARPATARAEAGNAGVPRLQSRRGKACPGKKKLLASPPVGSARGGASRNGIGLRPVLTGQQRRVAVLHFEGADEFERARIVFSHRKLPAPPDHRCEPALCQRRAKESGDLWL